MTDVGTKDAPAAKAEKAPKPTSCPECGHPFSSPKSRCSNKTACAKRKAERDTPPSKDAPASS